MNLNANKSSDGFELPSLFSERRPKKRRKQRKKSRQKTRRPLLRFVIYAITLFVVISVLPILLLRWVDPPTSSFMLQRHWQAYANDNTDFALHYQWTDWRQISPELKIAVVAAEDQQFPSHIGFDFMSIWDAVKARQSGKSSRGASTISQQVIKNLFLWPEPSWFRKGIEAYLTLVLETLWPKQRVLEVYLNIAQWGDNQYGAQAAAERYFAKNAGELNRSEAALLAAVLPNPTIYRVDNPSNYIRKRQRWIAGQIKGLGGPGYLAGL